MKMVRKTVKASKGIKLVCPECKYSVFQTVDGNEIKCDGCGGYWWLEELEETDMQYGLVFLE